MDEGAVLVRRRFILKGFVWAGLAIAFAVLALLAAH